MISGQSRAQSTRTTVRAALSAFAVVVLAFLAFAPVVFNGFVNMDDNLNFLENHEFRGLGWDQVAYAFTTPRLGVYQPLGSLLLSVQYTLFGLNASGYHATSLLIHCVNAALLVGLIHRILRRCRPAADLKVVWFASVFSAAWYAIHPQRTEPIAWATAQLYLPCASCSIFAVWAYLRAFDVGASRCTLWLAVSFGCSIAAMLFMPGAVCLPFVFLILDVYPLRRIAVGQNATQQFKRLAVEKLPLLLPAFALMAAAYWAKRSSQMLTWVEYDGVWTRVAQSSFGVCYYVVRLVWPFGISPFYPRPEQSNYSTPAFALAVAAVILVSTVAYTLRRRFPALLASWAAFVVVVAPHIGLIRVGNTLVADRYGYLAGMVGAVVIAAIIASAFQRVRSRWQSVACAPIAVVLLAGLISLSRTECRVWGNGLMLWQRAVELAPWSAQVHTNRGTALGESGRFADALLEYDQALRINPKFVEAMVGRSTALAGLRRFDDAIECGERILRLRPDHPNAHLNLGAALAELGRIDEAIVHFEQALESQPDQPQAELKLAAALMRKGLPNLAESHYANVIKRRPWTVEGHAGRGAALALLGRLDEAIAADEEALRLEPGSAAARTNLGLAYAQSSRLDEAISQLEAAVRADANDVDARHALGATLAQAGKYDRAIDEFALVLKANPEHAQAKQFLADCRRFRDESTRR